MTNDELPDDLARALKGLDGDAARTAQRLDPERVAGGVLDRLRREPEVLEVPAAPSRHWRGGTLRIAAALVVLVIGGAIARRLAIAPLGTDDGGLPVAWSADSIDAGQVTELLAAVDQVGEMPVGEVDSAATTGTISMYDLSESELRTLLRIMESSEETK